MKKLLIVVLVLAICVVGFGFYRGWFALSSPDSEGGDRVNINLATDTGKMQDDADAVRDKAAELTGNSAEETPRSAPDENAKADDELHNE
jgi:hypothetical protein